MSILVEDPTIRPLPRATSTVGIDAGLTSLLTLSTGEKISNPRHERRDREKLAKAQRNLARRTRATLRLAFEDLTVRNMVRNHALARAISDASWSELRRMLEYKADWYGRQVVAVDRWYPSSKICSTCGSVAASMPLSAREWECSACGALHDRDMNAARNILTAGLAAAMPVEAA